MENIEFLDFCKTSFSLSKKHSFLFEISQSTLFWIDLPKKKKQMIKVPLFDKNHGPLENFDIFGIF